MFHGNLYVTTQANMYLDTMDTRMLIESSSKNHDLPVNVIRYTSPAGTRTETIMRNTNFEIPDKYVVGESKIQVFIDDVHCCIGTEYNEVGLKGEESNIIQFVDWDITPDRNLEYIIIGRDYLTISVNGSQMAKVNNNIDLIMPTKTSDLVNNSGFITASANVASANLAKKTVGTLTVQKNGSTVATFNGEGNITANISVPTAVSELSGSDLIVYSKDNTIEDIRIISKSAYDALNKNNVANNTVYLVYE